jgi:hypothetical protein
VILPPPPLDGSKLLGLVKSNSFSRSASFASEGGSLHRQDSQNEDDTEELFGPEEEFEPSDIPNRKPLFASPAPPSPTVASAVSPAASGGAGKVSSGAARSKVAILIEDGDDLGDQRIEASKLRTLLINRPDLTALLLSCIEEEGLRGFKPLDTFHVE